MVPPKLRRLLSSVIRIMSRARCFSFFASDGKSFCSTRWHSTHLRPRLACIDCIAAMKRSALTAPSSFTFLKMVPAGRFPVSPQSRPTGVSLPGIVMGLIRSARGTPASDENVPPSAGPPLDRGEPLARVLEILARHQPRGPKRPVLRLVQGLLGALQPADRGGDGLCALRILEELAHRLHPKLGRPFAQRLGRHFTDRRRLCGSRRRSP